MKAPISQGPREFPVLETDMLRDEDKALIRAELAKFKTAYDLSQHAGDNGFALTSLDPRGRVRVISFKGIEVALMFQRRAMKLNLGPCETTPGTYLRSLDEAWMRTDLLDVSATKVVVAEGQTLATALEELRQAKSTIEHMQRETSAQRLVINQQTQTIEVMTDRLKKKLKKAVPATPAPTLTYDHIKPPKVKVPKVKAAPKKPAPKKTPAPVKKGKGQKTRKKRV